MMGILSLGVGAILLYSGIKNRSPLGIAKGIAAGNFDFSKVGAITTASTSNGSGAVLASTSTTTTQAPVA